MLRLITNAETESGCLVVVFGLNVNGGGDGENNDVLIDLVPVSGFTIFGLVASRKNLNASLFCVVAK